jgi:hypothetical protein
MAGDRPRYGFLVSAVGATVLGISVFLPWYGVTFTAEGLAFAQRIGNQVAARFGNATLQSYMSTMHDRLNRLAGQEFTSLSAHQALTNLNVVLLVLAGLASVLALLALAGPESASSQANRGPLALLGALATLAVLYRMTDPPSPAGGLLALSLREGAWLALLGSLAITAGALWPRRTVRASSSQGAGHGVWSELSGWTPET